MARKNPSMQALLEEPSFSETDREWIAKFYEEVEHRVKEEGGEGIHQELNLFDIADTIGLELSSLHKEGLLMYALWVTLLTVLKKHSSLSDLKYPTLQAFHEAYNGLYSYEDEEEQHRLWQTANWMSVLFTLIMARKNKGLAMQVVPKLVEGWHTKYVTGSGQTRLTANRVHLFETEGGTKANHRGKVKPKKKALPKRSVRSRPVVNKRRKINEREAASVQEDGDGDGTDNDDSSVNEDVAQTFSLWRGQELLRTSSLFDLTSTDLSPSELQRGVSWTEIPISMISSPSQPNGPILTAPTPIPGTASTGTVPSVSPRYKCFSPLLSPDESMCPPPKPVDAEDLRSLFSGYTLPSATVF